MCFVSRTERVAPKIASMYVASDIVPGQFGGL